MNKKLEIRQLEVYIEKTGNIYIRELVEIQDELYVINRPLPDYIVWIISEQPLEYPIEKT